jgi:hypothetical protein
LITPVLTSLTFARRVCHEETITQDPIRIILSRTSDPDLTPENVLLSLETGADLNKFSTGTSVKQITGNKVVKYGMVSAAEAFNMEYVRTRTKINIPTVHLVFYHAGRTYIVMDYVLGSTLQDTWASFDQSERLKRASQLADVIAQLRAMPHSTTPGPPNPSPGSKCEGRWFTFFGAGPFRSHHDLVMWLNRKLSIARRGGGEEMSARPMFNDAGPLVFTHQDLAARNLILDDNGNLWVIDYTPYYNTNAITMSSIFPLIILSMESYHIPLTNPAIAMTVCIGQYLITFNYHRDPP